MGKLPVLAAVAAGGAIGSVGRYGLAVALPHQPTDFPWATFITNAAGCFAIGVLMVVVAQVLPGRPLLRPFLGVGVLGGFTTFSTYALEIQRMVDDLRIPVGEMYDQEEGGVAPELGAARTAGA